MLQQLCNPLGVLDVGLPARNLLPVPAGSPATIQTTHPRCSTPASTKTPVASMATCVTPCAASQSDNSRRSAGHGTEGTQIRIQFPRSYRCDGPPRQSFPCARSSPAHALIDDLHDTPSTMLTSAPRRGIGKEQQSASRAPRPSGATIAGSRRHPGQTNSRARSSIERRPSTKTPEVFIHYNYYGQFSSFQVPRSGMRD